MSGEPILSKVAFLGPAGTYTHQAAYDKFGTSVQYCEKKTVSDVLDAVSLDIPLGIVPQENTTFGAVIETTDLLRLPVVGQEKFVVGEITIAINHCLVVRKGVKAEDINVILSHEQALGQCQKFISTNFPKASTLKMPSTAAAAEALLVESDDRWNPLRSAAICSRVIINILEGLQVLREGIQDAKANFTRFYLLSIQLDISDFLPAYAPLNHALVRLSVPTYDQTSPACLITELLRALDLSAKRIDRRPSLDPLPFHDVYLVEIQENCAVRDSLGKQSSWISDVETGLQRVRSIGGVASLLGIW